MPGLTRQYKTDALPLSQRGRGLPSSLTRSQRGKSFWWGSNPRSSAHVRQDMPIGRRRTRYPLRYRSKDSIPQHLYRVHHHSILTTLKNKISQKQTIKVLCNYIQNVVRNILLNRWQHRSNAIQTPYTKHKPKQALLLRSL